MGKPNFKLNFIVSVPIEISKKDYARGEAFTRETFELAPDADVCAYDAVTQLIVNDATIESEVDAAVNETTADWKANWIDKAWDVKPR